MISLNRRSRTRPRRQPLKPATSGPARYPQGPFAAILSPTKLSQYVGAYPDALEIVALAAMPDVDGHGWIEAVAEDGVRHRKAIDLVAFRAGFLMVRQSISFDLDVVLEAVGLGLVDHLGRLVAYGAFAGGSYASSPGRHADFPVGRITVQRAA